MVDRAVLARSVPFAVYMTFIVIADVLERLGVQAPLLRYVYPVKMAAVLLALWYYWHSYTELDWVRLPLRSVVVACLVGALVLLLWVNLDAAWMTIGRPAGFDPRTDGTIDPLLAAVRLSGAALVVPVMEELFWRSFLLRWLKASDFLSVKPAQVGLKAFAVTVVLFGFEHNLWLAGMVAGAAYSVLYMRSQSLWSPVLAHGVTNGLLGVWVLTNAQWTYW